MKRLLAFTTALAALVVAFTLLATAAVPSVPSNTWLAGGDLSEVRAGASATLLPDGRVLVAGGIGDNGASATAERFSPDGGAFMAAAPMQQARANHTATLLPDGRVLVAGGASADGTALAGAELYDAVNNVWLPAGSLNVARRGHTATLLADGRVLIAGGDSTGVAVESLEIYDPTTQQFSTAGTMSSARTQHGAALLADGRVALIGGNDGNTALASSDIFDPATGAVSAGPSMGAARSGLSATTLLDGRVLVAGGSTGSIELASAEVLNTGATGFTATDNNLRTGRQNHLAILLPHNNQVLVVGGQAGENAVGSAEYFTPWDGTNGAFCAVAVCASGYAGPVVPEGTTARAWAAGSALSFAASATNRSGPADGLAVVAGGTGQKSSALFGFATVKTDKDDYAPFTTVRITGSGWQPGEWVALTLVESPNFDTHPLLDVKADSNGNIVSTEFAPDEHDVDVRFYLTAFGTASQATTTFTDAVQTSTAIASNNNPSNFGDNVKFTATVTCNACTFNSSQKVDFLENANANCNGGITLSSGNAITITNNTTSSATAVATFVTSSLTPGSHSIRACFIGGGPNPTAGASTSDPLSQTVRPQQKTTPTVSITNSPVVYSGIAQAAAVTGSVAGVVSNIRYNGSTVVPITVGTYAITVDFVPSDTANFNSLTNASAGNFVISQASSITTVSCPLSVTYNGSAQTPCTASVTGAGGLSLTPTVTHSNNTDAGTASASYAFTGDANHTGSTDSKNFTISKAPSTTVVTIVGGPFTYTGAAITPATVAVTSVGGLSLTPTATYTNNVNAGTATASYSYAGDANHEASSDSKTFVIGKALTTTVVTINGGPFTYTGSAITPATVAVTGGGLNLAPTANYANNIDAGTATASYSYAGDTNHEASTDSKTFAIAKAPTTTVVTIVAGPFTYTGSAITPATVAVTGGGLNLAPTANYANNIDAGTATASYSYAGDTNHEASTDSKTFAIAKAPTTTVVTIVAGPFTYTGSAITPATVAVTGAGGLNLTPIANYADNVNAGTATASYSYAGDANHETSSDSKTFVIGKALTTTVVTINGGPFTYTGSAITPATVTVTGGGLNLTPTAGYANNIEAGTATASYSYAGDTNHAASSDSKTFVIGKALTTTLVTIVGGPFTYTGSPITPATVTVTGAGGLNLTPIASYADNVNAGTATASYSYAGDANHETSSDSKTFVIGKALTTTVVTIVGGPFTYTGSATTPATVVVTGGGLNLTPTASYANNTDAGSATASYSYAGDTNHAPSSDSKNFTIDQAASVTTVSCQANATYTGSPVTPCTATVTGAGGLNQSVTVNYTNNTNAGLASANASFSDANHAASSDSKTFTIDPASSVTTLTCPANVTYTGSPLTACSALATGAGGLSVSVTVNYTNNTNVGTASANATFAGDGNHTGSSDAETFTIGKASSTTTVSCPSNTTYTGSALTPCSATATGAGSLNQSLTVNYSNNTNAGMASASASFAGDANHTGSSDSKSFAIDKATSVTMVTIIGGPFTYTGAAFTPATVAVTGAGGLNLTPTANYANNIGAGTATASYTFAGDANHLGSADSKNFSISQATSMTVVTVSNALWDGIPHGGTANVTGAGALTLPLPITYTGVLATAYGPSLTAPTAAGDYKASATFVGDSNHLGSSDAKTYSIASWTENGYFQPIDMSPASSVIWNTVKGGSTVPVKFEIFAGAVEKTNPTTDVKSITAKGIACVAGGEIAITIDELATAGNTVLRYDSTSGFFITNWQTPKPANQCYELIMTAADGSTISRAFFKTK